MSTAIDKIRVHTCLTCSVVFDFGKQGFVSDEGEWYCSKDCVNGTPGGYGDAMTYIMFDQYEWNTAMQSEFEHWASDKPLNLDADDAKRHKSAKGPDGRWAPINPYKDSLTRIAYDLWMASRDNDKLSEKINDERIRLALREKKDPTCIEAITEFLRNEEPEFVLDSFAVACRLRKQELAAIPADTVAGRSYGNSHLKLKLQEMEVLINRVMIDVKDI